MLLGCAWREARRARQTETVGNQIEIIAHSDFRIVGRIVRPVASSSAQRGTRQPGQIIGMNVIGEHIVVGAQDGLAFSQTGKRKAFCGIDSRGAQDADDDSAAAERAQLALGVDPSSGTCGRWLHGAGFVYPTAGTVAIDAGRAYIHDSLW